MLETMLVIGEKPINRLKQFMIFHILSEISFPQAKLVKAKRKHAKTKALHNQLLTEAGLLEWELEEAKYKYQQMVPRDGKSGRHC